MHFAGFSSNTLPSCELGAHSEMPYKMYNAALLIRVHQSFWPFKRKAAVVLPRGHTGTRTQAEASTSTYPATKVDVDGSIPFKKKKKKQLILFF